MRRSHIGGVRYRCERIDHRLGVWVMVSGVLTSFPLNIFTSTLYL